MKLNYCIWPFMNSIHVIINEALRQKSCVEDYCNYADKEWRNFADEDIMNTIT